MATILIIILVLALLGVLPTWPHSRGWGFGPSGLLGLIILAGRNQHMHFGDEPLRDPNVSIFARLASFGSMGGDETVHDPAFDLENKNLVSFAHNITALIGWRSFGNYQRDLRELLEQ